MTDKTMKPTRTLILTALLLAPLAALDAADAHKAERHRHPLR